MSIQYIVKTSEPFSGFCHTYIKNGVIQWSKAKTFEEYQKRHADETFEIWSEEKFLRKSTEFYNSLCNHFSQITKERYIELMEVLPPLRFDGSSWFMCEFEVENITSFLCAYREKYYTSLQRITRTKPGIFADLSRAIQENRVQKDLIELCTDAKKI